MTIQCVLSAIVCVASVLAHTEARPSTEPTDRSMPPPVMTKVIPMLSTPITAASRRIVRMLLTLTNRSPAVMTPTTQSATSAMMRPEVAAGRRRSGAAGADGWPVDAFSTRADSSAPAPSP